MSNEAAVTKSTNPFAVANTAASPVSMAAGAQALVQRTLAEVQVAVMMAKQFPRDKIYAREKLVNDCCREGLAAVATYSYSRGGSDVTGPTIRFAEAVKNAWGNLQSGFRELSRQKGVDGVMQSEVEAFAWDAENNTRESTVFIVKHWRDTKKGGYELKDERDIRELISNQAKRVERTCIINSIDGDIIEAGLRQCNETLTKTIVITPERITSMVKMFAEYNVTKDQLEKRIQRRIDTINSALMISLTKIFNSLKDGMSKPEDWFDMGEEKPKTGNEGLKQKLQPQKEPEPEAKKEDDEPAHDPETGEIVEPSAPPQKITVQKDETGKPKWVDFAVQFQAAVEQAPDALFLAELEEIHKTELTNYGIHNSRGEKDLRRTIQDRAKVLLAALETE